MLAATAPPAPTITSPANGATVTSPVAVTWSGGVSPYVYTLWRNGVAVPGCVDLSYTSNQCSDSGASGSVSYIVSACSGINNAQPCSGSASVAVIVASSTMSSETASVPAAPYLNPINSSGTSVYVYWNAASGASYYNVYRRTPPSTGSWSQVAMNLGETFYGDFSVIAGASYQYHVNACNSYGCSADSNSATVSVANVGTATTTIPAAPSGLTAAASGVLNPLFVSTNPSQIYFRHWLALRELSPPDKLAAR